MADGIWNSFKAYIMDGSIDLDTDDIRIALLDSGFTPNSDTQHYWGDISANEVSGDGYSAGGEELTGVDVSIDDTDNEGVFDASDVTWSNSTITARYAVIYDSTHASDLLIGWFDFTSDQESASGDFKVQFNAEGLVNLG